MGVGVRISELSPSALRAHCQMHCVNLAVQDVVKAIPVVRDFLHFVNNLVFLLRNFPKRCETVHNTALELDNPQTHPMSYSFHSQIFYIFWNSLKYYWMYWH